MKERYCLGCQRIFSYADGLPWWRVPQYCAACKADMDDRRERIRVRLAEKFGGGA